MADPYGFAEGFLDCSVGICGCPSMTLWRYPWLSLWQGSTEWCALAMSGCMPSLRWARLMPGEGVGVGERNFQRVIPFSNAFTKFHEIPWAWCASLGFP